MMLIDLISSILNEVNQTEEWIQQVNQHFPAGNTSCISIRLAGYIIM
jgi:hypothetical protein